MSKASIFPNIIPKVLQDDIENIISYKFLTGEIHENSIVFITGKGDQLIFKTKTKKTLSIKQSKSGNLKVVQK